MNDVRRKQIKEVIDELEHIKARLEDLQSEEQEYADNMPENLQGSERHELAEEAASNLDEAASGVDEIVSQLESAVA